MPVELTKPTPSTAADKAAALTYLKSNYNWPKSIQFGSGENSTSYNLTFVTNNSTGTITMNVLKQVGELTSEHCGTAFLDALIMVDLSDEQRTELVSKAAELSIQDHIEKKKKFILMQMQALANQSVGAELQSIVQANATHKQQASTSAFAGLLGAIGSGVGGFAGLGLSKNAVGAQKVIQDLQNAQLSILKQKVTPPTLMCPVCAKTWTTWTGPAPQKCPKCGHLVISSEAGEAKLAQEKQTQKMKMWPVQIVPVDVKAKLKPMQPLQISDDEFKDTSNDEQKFIQRVGVMSNLNVSIQGKKRIGITVYRLFCDKCKTPRDIEAGVITQRRIEDKVLVEFCNTHRHVSIVPQAEGERKFKDV